MWMHWVLIVDPGYTNLLTVKTLKVKRPFPPLTVEYHCSGLMSLISKSVLWGSRSNEDVNVPSGSNLQLFERRVRFDSFPGSEETGLQGDQQRDCWKPNDLTGYPECFSLCKDSNRVVWSEGRRLIKNKSGCQAKSSIKNFQAWTRVMLCTLMPMASDDGDNGHECRRLNKSTEAGNEDGTSICLCIIFSPCFMLLCHPVFRDTGRILEAEMRLGCWFYWLEPPMWEL